MNGNIVSFGEIVWDMSPDYRLLGGAPLNFAYYASKLGFNSYIISALGDDDLGVEAYKEINSRGIKTDGIRILKDFPTGVVNVLFDEAGKPSYNIMNNAAWDNISSRNSYDFLKGAKAFAFGSLSQRSPKSRVALWHYIDALPKDCLKVFDSNLRQNFYDKDIIEHSLEVCNLLKISDEELGVFEKMFAKNSKDAALEIFKSFGLDYLLLTCGAKGYRIIFGDNEDIRGESDEIEIVDTVGAGDSFTSAFVCGILNNETPMNAGIAAKKLAQKVCSNRGAMCL